MESTGLFFTMNEAVALAIEKFGPNARCWYREPPHSPDHVCEVGTGGAGMSHVSYGHGATWLDAARTAGLL